jgi:hypothetical protein
VRASNRPVLTFYRANPLFVDFTSVERFHQPA